MIAGFGLSRIVSHSPHPHNSGAIITRSQDIIRATNQGAGERRDIRKRDHESCYTRSGLLRSPGLDSTISIKILRALLGQSGELVAVPNLAKSKISDSAAGIYIYSSGNVEGTASLAPDAEAKYPIQLSMNSSSSPRRSGVNDLAS